MATNKKSLFVAPHTKTPRSPPWTEAAELRLAELVKASWKILYGEAEGCGAEGGIAKLRRLKWSEIASKISTEHLQRQDGEQCRRKYQNLKTRTINKVDEQRHPKTGGGPGADLKTSEQFIEEHLHDHPSLKGINGGVDTDSFEIIPLAPKEKATTETATAEIMTETGTGTETGPATLPIEEASSPSTSGRIKTPSKTPIKKSRKGKRSADETLEELTRQNLALDNERIQAETALLHLKASMCEEQRETLRAVRDAAMAAKSYMDRLAMADFSSGIPLLDQFLTK